MTTSLFDQLRTGRLEAYRHAPDDIQEHVEIEEEVLAGSYSYRQVVELVQNGADAILEDQQEIRREEDTEARITVKLVDQFLYVGNTGAPLSTVGARALLQSHSSPKRGNQIGRFGIGFKSLLRLGGRIDLISRSMSMRFDPDKARDLIRREMSLANSIPVPGLRIAWGLDGEAERNTDPVLGEFGWATTIVRAEIRDPAMLGHLREEMERFPAPFLLFLPVPVKLTMDFGGGTLRSLERRPEGKETILIDGEDASRWSVVEREIAIPNADAISDARKLHARNKVPIAWAMPLDSKQEETGRFWAFFPTETLSRMPGIINAPWKLNSDRKSLIDGDWNKVLMREAAAIISEALPNISVPEDPARVLDAFPRRLDRQDEIAATLVEELWNCLSQAEVIPDAEGTLRLGSDLKRHPLDDMDLAQRWTAVADSVSLGKVVHPGCLNGINRKGRLEELSQRISKLAEADSTQEQPLLQRMTSAAWLKEIASSEPAKAMKVLAVTEAYADAIKQHQWRTERGGLEVIPKSCGGVCRVDSAIIAPEGVEVPNRFRVHDHLVQDDESLRILTQVLDIGLLDKDKWSELLSAALSNSSERWVCNSYKPDACVRFWDLLRASPEDVAIEFVESSASAIPLKRHDGKWRNAGAVLLPGAVVASDDEQNNGFIIDDVFHKGDDNLVKLIGVAVFPSGKFGPDGVRALTGDDSGLLSDWLRRMRQLFVGTLASGKNPQHGCLHPRSNIVMPFGWMLVCELVEKAKARASQRLLGVVAADGDYLSPIRFGHESRPDVYPSIAVASPICWLLCNFGTVELGSHLVPIRAILRKVTDPILERAAPWGEMIPKLKRIGEAVEATCTKADIAVFWDALIESLVSQESLSESWIRGLWDSMADDGCVPAMLPSPSGMVSLSEVYYTTSRDLARHARAAGLLVVEVAVETGLLWQKYGAKGLDDLFRLGWDAESERDSLLVQAVPEVAGVLKTGISEVVFCRTVSGLKIVFEEHSGDVACVMWEGKLHQDLDQLQALSRFERLERILAEIENAGWLDRSAADALRIIADVQVDSRRKYVAEGCDLADRLLRAVGERASALTEAIGESAGRALSETTTPRQLSELALALLGPLVLQRVVEHLRKEGLNPPARWGTVDARHFVSQLGFPEDFAVAAESKRDPELIVAGPIQLPPLHDFQEEVVEGLRSICSRSDGRRRAVVCLPTGGGKTRATVQAAVELILVPPSKQRSVLWIAQTDELCEQAVQAFRQVWANVGAESTDLRVVRLWGGHHSPARSEDGQPVVVVASIQTLNSRVGQEDLAWLSTPGLVVIDECHHAITKSYTGVLSWLDADSSRSGSKPGKEPPVIGLSATPFRSSRDDDESIRLAKRFDETWLPRDQENLYRNLLRRGILAKAEHESLESDASIPEELLARLEGLDTDSIQIENILEQINQSLAGNKARNDLLVKTISESSALSILCFANSVGHAEELAARLCVNGISSAAVSGETPRSARRYFLSRFQAGDIRVLCNYAVLSTGFDAPKTDMLVISRQVMSPVRYMQMVGRGLRGVENRGTERCRIVTVLDNLGRFSDKHPYHYCAKFFTEQGSKATSDAGFCFSNEGLDGKINVP